MEGDWKVANNAGMIIDLDKKRMRAMAAKDTATLLADDLVYTHSSARLDTKQSLIANMKSGATVYSAADPSEVWAQDLGDAVILTGVAQIKVSSNGKDLDFRVRFTDAYAKRSGRWQMVVSQSTRLPDRGLKRRFVPSRGGLPIRQSTASGRTWLWIGRKSAATRGILAPHLSGGVGSQPATNRPACFESATRAQ
jgi:hypothetical protein